jgi:anti-anti-sigma factor
VIRTHRLRIRGALSHDSAAVLEAEIDALLESGIEELVLDLGELRAIDATGVLVIAMRCELCRKRGARLELTHADGSVGEALEQVGLAVVMSTVKDGGGRR